MKFSYSIFYPGGNATALVNKLVLKPNLKKLINDKIMILNPLVEQVGFIDQKNYQLEMAGGEFCGNATRCAAFYYLNSGQGKIKLKVSGVAKKLATGIDANNNVWAQMPILPNPVTKRLGYTVINLEGITQVIASSKPSKQKAKSILNKLGLINSVPAAGVMFISKNRLKIKLDPFVWVRDIKTFYYETACASGTAAVGLFLALQQKRNIDNLKVIQPSGLTIFVNVTFSKKVIKKVIINGPIKILKKDLILNL